MEEDSQSQRLVEGDPSSWNLEEKYPKSKSLREGYYKLPSLEETDPKSQSLQEGDLKSQSLVEKNPESQSLEEEDPKPLCLEKQNPKSQSLEEEEDPRPLSLEEEYPKPLSLEERDGIEVPRFDVHSLQFLDSIDGYLTLLDSLSWTLRQGWLQLASARHSMGESRVNSAVLDLKSHSASTFVQVAQHSNLGAEQIHHFTLRKWVSYGNDNDNGARPVAASTEIRQRKDKEGALPSEADHQHQLHKERSKSLLVFGGLVSPKLRAAQLSFESALDALVEIANMRSLMLSTFHKVSEELNAAKAE